MDNFTDAVDWLFKFTDGRGAFIREFTVKWKKKRKNHLSLIAKGILSTVEQKVCWRFNKISSVSIQSP